MAQPVIPVWKGLRTDRSPVFLSCDQVERMLAALHGPVAAWAPDAVAGILRGGMIPAAMLACTLGLPLLALKFDRRHGGAAWVGPPPTAARILVVDDSCSTGVTLRLARDLAARTGAAVATAAIVHDPDVARFTPDFSHPMRELFRLPWERGEATPAARAARAQGIVEPWREAPFVGIDLDGVFLPDVARARYEQDLAAALDERHGLDPFAVLPDFAPGRAVIITGRPEMDRAPTAAWLARAGHAGIPLECRPDGIGHTPEHVAAYKAEIATRWGCTHFVESEPEQAIRIAALAPHLSVAWWSAADARLWQVGSAPHPAIAARIPG